MNGTRERLDYNLEENEEYYFEYKHNNQAPSHNNMPWKIIKQLLFIIKIYEFHLSNRHFHEE